MQNLPSRQHRVVVLLSGGIDSTACVDFFLREGFEAKAIFVDYGQQAAAKEHHAAIEIADFFGINLKMIRCLGVRAKNDGLILGRNAFLLFTALMEIKSSSGLLALGIHSGTRYWDCSQEFISHIQFIFDSYTHGQIQLAAPFISWTKPEIWEYCQENELPTNLTYSCELGHNQPCGQCLSCRDLESLHART